MNMCIYIFEEMLLCTYYFWYFRSPAKMFRMGGMDKNKLNVISNIKAGTAHWRKYVTSKRKTTAQGKL